MNTHHVKSVILIFKTGMHRKLNKHAEMKMFLVSIRVKMGEI